MFFYSHWLSLPLHVRAKIAQRFNIKKSGPTHVVNNSIQSDGYAIKDVEDGLSVVKIQEFLNTKEDSLVTLWDLLVKCMEDPAPFKVTEESIQALKEEPIISTKKKLGRPKKVIV